MNQPSGHVCKVKRQRGEQWYARYRELSGRQVQKRLGPAWNVKNGRPPEGYYTKATAEAALREILVDAARGGIAGPHRGGHTFADAVEAWLEHRERERGIKPSTLRDYRNTARSKLEAELGADTPIEKIGEEAVVAYKSKRLGKVSARTVQKEMVMLHGIFEVARRSKRIKANPAADVEKIRVQSSGDFNVLEPEQVYAVAEKAATRLDRAVILVAAFTGLRLGELRALRWRSVRFDLAAVQVRESFATGALTRPKSGKVRTVPLTDGAARLLDELSRRELFTGPDDLVFPSEVGGYRDDGEIRDAFYGALEAAGLGHLREKEEDPIVFHDLRHTFGSVCAANNIPLTKIQQWMGHRDIQTTQRYLHTAPAHGDAAELTAAFAPVDVSRAVSRTAELEPSATETNGHDSRLAGASETA